VKITVSSAAKPRKSPLRADTMPRLRTIRNYADAARTLDRWMTASETDADFTACDTTVLNRFFADYLRTHTQGGTKTLQRNLARLFALVVWREVIKHEIASTMAALDRFIWPSFKVELEVIAAKPPTS
jgi:hypothetical protein